MTREFDGPEERWRRYLRAAEMANLARVSVAEDLHDLAILDRIHNPTAARLRADHLLLVNVVTELLGLDPGKMTTGDILRAMVERSRGGDEEIRAGVRWALRRAGSDVPPGVQYRVLPESQKDVADSDCDKPHPVNRYLVDAGVEVLATWCPKLNVVWWRRHG